jgi:apolipoprotein D and lipocalin family protein
MWLLWIVLLWAAMLGGCAAGGAGGTPATVERVDLARYAGTWYEIARLPQGFEEGCTGVTATYTLRPDGKVQVVNRCHEGSLDGRVRDIKGTARSVNPPANSRLKVTFFWPFEGDYWVFRLDDAYTTAAVGSPDRKTLWILHRQPTMDAAEYDRLLASLKTDGFPVERLEKTVQAP